MNTYEEFLDLRKRLFEAMDKYYEEDEACGKSYEGQFSISLNFPNYFQESDIPTYNIHLDMYIIAPIGRHHDWCGKTFEEAFEKCKNDILVWIKCF